MGKKLILLISMLSFFKSILFSQELKTAAKYFKAGEFDKADAIYTDILKEKPDNFEALVYKGYVSQIANHIDESEYWLTRAAAINPKSVPVKSLLAENFYRKNQFREAAAYFRLAKRSSLAAKLESFEGKEPYKKPEQFDSIRLKFLVTDPLPVVEVVINSQFSGCFFINTGGGELILDRDFADKIHPLSFGVEKSYFGGGKTAGLEHITIQSITLDNQIIMNIPAVIIGFNGLELGGCKVDGCIGTVFLYQFLSTIDYKNGEMILRNKEKYNTSDIAASSQDPEIIPFFMAGNHFMIAHGNVNDSGKMLFFINTGLGGNAFTCPESTLKRAGLTYSKDDKTKGLGGGGYFKSYPVLIDKICLGNLCRTDLHGSFGAFPSQLEHSLGFDINGLLSHEFFRNHTLTIDFQEMKYIIVR